MKHQQAFRMGMAAVVAAFTTIVGGCDSHDHAEHSGGGGGHKHESAHGGGRSGVGGNEGGVDTGEICCCRRQ